MSRIVCAAVLLQAILFFGPSQATAATACEDLSKLTLPNTTITLAHDINVELWMPVAASWNGKFRGTGNAGLENTRTEFGEPL